jgi:hypothetical protein
MPLELEIDIILPC